jgi:hypothetical protein
MTKQPKITLINYFFFTLWFPCPYIFIYLFLFILIFFLKDNINVDSMKKINNDFEIDVLIAERVENKFLNFKLF